MIRRGAACIVMFLICFLASPLLAQTRWADDVRITDLTQNVGSPKLVALENGTLYMACTLEGVSSAGLYRSDDGGASWTFDRHIISTDPVTPISIVAAGDEKLLVSLRAASASSHELRVWWLDLDSDATGSSVVDTGDMAMQISGGELCVDYRQYPDTWRVYIGYEVFDNTVLDTYFRFALSVDQGMTWTNYTGIGGTEGDYTGIDLAYGHGALYYIYSVAWPFSPPEICIRKSTNRGASWGSSETVEILATGSIFPKIVAAHGEPTVAVCFDEGITEDLAVRVSYDAGSTWTPANPPNDPDLRELYPQLAICSQDEKLALVWLLNDDPVKKITVSECALSTPTNWTTVETIVDDGGDPTLGTPSLAIDAARDDATCVAWIDLRDDPVLAAWFDSQTSGTAWELDQNQPVVDYGFWFASNVMRWQEFMPTLNTLAAVDLYIRRLGNPGNVILEIRTQDETLLGQVTVLEEDIQSVGWVRFELSPEIVLTPLSIYRIYVAADVPSPDANNRYFWRGTTESEYNPACSCSVQEGGGWPTFDFAFQTWGYHDPGLSATPQSEPDRSLRLANWPNPFNPRTTVGFYLPYEAAVNLRVYDVSGRLVDVLLDNEIARQGRNEVVWLGRDIERRVVPAGIYFYRLEAGGYVETKRMTLLK